MVILIIHVSIKSKGSKYKINNDKDEKLGMLIKINKGSL